jgi:sugar phosphate isomerase/epimerase
MNGISVEGVGHGPFAYCITALLADPVRGCSAHELRIALAACAEGGVDGTCVWLVNAQQAEADGLSRGELIDLHAAHGLQARIAQGLTVWARDPLDERAVRSESEPVLDFALELGASQVVAACLEPTLHPQIARGLGLAADLAADRGLQLGVEFVSFSALSTLSAARQLIEEADRPNLGLLLDSLHWWRQPGSVNPEQLRSLDSNMIHVFDVADAPGVAPGDLMGEAIAGRLLPGQGELDIAALGRVLDDMGARPIVAPEVMNPSLLSSDRADDVATVMSATRAVLSPSP